MRFLFHLRTRLFPLLLLAAASWVPAQVRTSTLTFPANGSVGIDSNNPFQWTPISDAQCYYLYVGSSPGAKDLHNSGEIPGTSRLVPDLPVGPTIYARIHTKIAGRWYYTDSRFTVSKAYIPGSAFVYPAVGSVVSDLTVPLRWTSIADAQCYYLYVGTAPGGKDLVDSGETKATSHLMPNLQPGRKYFARIHARRNERWYYSDTSFTTTAALKTPYSTLVYPAHGATRVDTTRPFEWTAVAEAERYYLYVGSAPRAKDLYESGEIVTTSRLVPSLPVGPKLYATIWTRVRGIWYGTDSVFSASTTYVPFARFTYPVDGGVISDLSLPFQWTSVPGARSYYLYVGTSPGSKDLIDTGEIQVTSCIMPNLPPGRVFYARIHTQINGSWYSSNATFTTASQLQSPYSTFVYPADRTFGVDTTKPFQWTVVPDADCYYLYVGTSPGGKDLHNSGEIQTTSRLAPGLPVGPILYARIWTKVRGTWYWTDSVFSASTTFAPQSLLIYPPNDSISVDLSIPFQWTSVASAECYYLYIGSTPGAKDLHDSGEIQTTTRFVDSLPSHATVYARLWTHLDGEWYYSDVSFRVAEQSPSFERRLQTALSLTDQVRVMADFNNLTLEGTLLYQMAASNGRRWALCTDYAQTLLKMLQESGIGPAHYLNIGFNSNYYDMHTLVELYNPEQQNWMLLDPTFSLSPQLTSDGLWATAEDISAASRSQSWGAISYNFLGALGDAVARNYYLDYPLLYLNVYDSPDSFVLGQGYSPLEFLEEVPLPISAWGLYVLRSVIETQTDILINNSIVTVYFNGIDSTSPVIYAGSISLPPAAGGGTRAFVVMRYVFR